MQKKLNQLDDYYKEVKAVILSKQHPITGLLPASTAINQHGNYTDAWVRDNVYSIMAVWALGLAYRKIDDTGGRTYELEQSSVKLMRGLLQAMMQQSAKVETFKHTHNPLDALHAKYDTATGEVIVADDAWGHLQLDATSLFLLMLTQMTASGLRIVFSLDEVSFIQNLVYYISHSYRIPDYGIWERGNKINKGQPEINTSSVAMSKAALESLVDFDLFGSSSSSRAVVQVLPDDIARARTVLEAMLPRESHSKEVDAAVLSSISFPAFAIDDKDITEKTYQKIVSSLEGKYGLKRFLRDGHQTALEAHERLYYEAEELQKFEDIESEWPLFYCYLYLDALFKEDTDKVAHYREALARVCVTPEGSEYKLLPELYIVPEAAIELERKMPKSQARVPNENIPLVWAQSLYIMGRLLDDELLDKSDIDPLQRHKQVALKFPIIQISLIAENDFVKQELSDRSVSSETAEDVGIDVYSARTFSKLYNQLGHNEKLKLTGRPLQSIGSLTSSRLYYVNNKAVICLPVFFDSREFYLGLDPEFLVNRLRSELTYIHRNWTQIGRPTVVLYISETLLGLGRKTLLKLMNDLRDGYCFDVPVKLRQLKQLMLSSSFERILFNGDIEDLDESIHQRLSYHLKPTVASIAKQTSADRVKESSKEASKEHNSLSPEEELALELEIDVNKLIERLSNSSNLYEQVEILEVLASRFSHDGNKLNLDASIRLANQEVTLRQLLEECYFKASRLRLWAVVRHSAGLLDKTDSNLVEVVVDIVNLQKQILVGKSYSQESLISQPQGFDELHHKIHAFSRDDIRDEVLTQEVLIYLSSLIKSEPELFEGMLTLRVGYFILLITNHLSNEQSVSQDEAYEQLMALAPSKVQSCLRDVIAGFEEMSSLAKTSEYISSEKGAKTIDFSKTVKPSTTAAQEPEDGWRQWRRHIGALSKLDKEFHPKLWQLMHHFKGLIIGDKLKRSNRIDSSSTLSEMTAGEANFALLIEHLFNRIQAPEYRQLNIEALESLASFLATEELLVNDYLVLDVLIGHAVRLAFVDEHPELEGHYEDHKSEAWEQFYSLKPQDSSSYFIKSFDFLLSEGDRISL